MKTILFLSRGGVGGSQMQLAHVVGNLPTRGFRPVVVCREEGPFAEMLREAQVPAYVVPLRPWRTWPAARHRYADVRRLARIARRHNAALVHASDLWLSGYLLALRRKLNLPGVLHARAPLETEQLTKHRCAKADAVIAISPRVRDQLLAAGVDAERIHVIYDAVDLRRFRPDESGPNVLRRDFPHAGEVLVGIVGRIDPAKRQLEFLRVAAHVLEQVKRSVTIFIVGEARNAEYGDLTMQYVRSNGLHGRAVFTGIRRDMPETLRALDVLVTLSGGSVMIEAMAVGTPVVSAGFTPADRSFIVQHGRNGLLVPPEGSHNGELAAVLRRLIESPDLRRDMGREGRRWAEAHFSHLDLAAKTCDLYDQLLAE